MRTNKSFRLLSAFLCLLGASTARAATPVFRNDFSAVTLNGVRLGSDLNPSNLSLMPSVVYDASSGLFHMWVLSGASQSVEGLTHATSADGVHFVATGNLSFAGGNPFPAYGAPAEPPLVFPRAAKLGNAWKLLLWTHNEPAITGDYNYNESVNDIGADPATLAVVHQGPVYPTNGTGTYGQTTGPFGFVNGSLYVQDDRIGGISKWTFDDTTPPAVEPPAAHDQDLITGTGYVYFLTHPGDPLGVYVHNIGRVLDQGDGTLGVYYALRHPDGSRVNTQIYYAQSGDDGQSWSAPAGLFGNGDAVRVEGEPNTFAFSHPEVTLAGSRRILYFSTKAADGAFVVASSAAQDPVPGSWSQLLGNGDGTYDAASSVVPSGDGGYFVVGAQRDLAQAPHFWLVKVDGAGEVEWQKRYVGPGSALGGGYVARLVDGSLVMAAPFGAPSEEMSVVRVDANGQVLWSKTYTTCVAAVCNNSVGALAATADGGFAFATQAAGYGFSLGKAGADGALQWLHAYPSGVQVTRVDALVETPDGGLAAVGSWGGAPDSQHRVMRVDGTGAVLWDKHVAEPNLIGSFAGLVANRPGGGLLVGGRSWLVAYTDEGAVDWQMAYGGLNTFVRIVPSAGGFGLAGFVPSNTYQRASLQEIDATGVPLWQRSFAAETTSHTFFSGVTSAPDGGLMAVGSDADQGYQTYRWLGVKVDAGGGFVGCLDVESSGAMTPTVTSATPADVAGTVVDLTEDTTVSDAAVTVSDANAENVHCTAALPQTLEAAALDVDPLGNGVAEPGEPVDVDPAWTNFALAATTLSGHVAAISDSNGLDTSGPDPNADYGTLASLATADCLQATSDCYEFQLSNAPRPSQHWDTYADETLTGSDPTHLFAKRWTVHIGLSFGDVAPSSGFYPYVENLFHNGVTAGCGGGIYCPASSTTRAQMAAFLLKARYGASHVPPPATGTVFADVPADAPFAAWIEELASLGVTAGCGGGDYCPGDPVTRRQMSAFLLKTLEGAGYVPPPAVGIFGDVPVSDPFAPWIEDLYARQITAGCSASPLLYCPDQPNTREQMAVFLVKTFSLRLYAP